MLNIDKRKMAIKEHEKTLERHNKLNNEVTELSQNLFETRSAFRELLQAGWESLNSIRNKPEEFVVEINKIKIEVDRYDNFLESIQRDIDDSFLTSAGAVGTGVLAGAGVAALGPSAAMAIATTFGTASTGTAISTLSGAAATNAALAWLGGGALAAGGGGTAAGTALVALSGPIGWAIGGTAILGAAAFQNAKNKEAAEKTIAATLKLESINKVLEGIKTEIYEEIDLTDTTQELYKTLADDMIKKINYYNNDYNNIKKANDSSLIQQLGSFINNTKTGMMLINKSIGQKIKEV